MEIAINQILLSSNSRNVFDNTQTKNFSRNIKFPKRLLREQQAKILIESFKNFESIEQKIFVGTENKLKHQLKVIQVLSDERRDDVIGGVGPQVRDVFGGLHKNVGVGRLGVDVRNDATLKVQQNDEALKIWQSLAT